MTRQEIIKWMSNLKSDIGNAEHQSLWHYEQAIDMAIDALQDRPTGTWRGELKMPDFPRYEWYRCSECRFLSQSVVNYCPNCGLRMKR